ncbi:hypothetical protein ACTPOE_14800 [Castellaniella sp. WN]
MNMFDKNKSGGFDDGRFAGFQERRQRLEAMRGMDTLLSRLIAGGRTGKHAGECLDLLDKCTIGKRKPTLKEIDSLARACLAMLGGSRLDALLDGLGVAAGAEGCAPGRPGSDPGSDPALKVIADAASWERARRVWENPILDLHKKDTEISMMGPYEEETTLRMRERDEVLAASFFQKMDRAGIERFGIYISGVLSDSGLRDLRWTDLEVVEKAIRSCRDKKAPALENFLTHMNKKGNDLAGRSVKEVGARLTDPAKRISPGGAAEFLSGLSLRIQAVEKTHGLAMARLVGARLMATDEVSKALRLLRIRFGRASSAWQVLGERNSMIPRGKMFAETGLAGLRTLLGGDLDSHARRQEAVKALAILSGKIYEEAERSDGSATAWLAKVHVIASVERAEVDRLLHDQNKFSRFSGQLENLSRNLDDATLASLRFGDMRLFGLMPDHAYETIVRARTRELDDRVTGCLRKLISGIYAGGLPGVKPGVRTDLTTLAERLWTLAGSCLGREERLTVMGYTKDDCRELIARDLKRVVTESKKELARRSWRIATERLNDLKRVFEEISEGQEEKKASDAGEERAMVDMARSLLSGLGVACGINDEVLGGESRNDPVPRDAA